jgi:hypothetical protein
VTVHSPAGWDTAAGSLRALVEGLVDYAGLFPPAELDMPTTLRNYAEYLYGPDALMLGRLVVPAARLDELELHARGLLPHDAGTPPWHISALVASAGDEALPRDLERIAAFNQAHADPAAGLASIASIELRGPDTAALEGALDVIPDDLFPFFELSAGTDPRGLLAALSGSDAGAKVRTGGTRPDAYPQPEQLARFIHAAASAEVPFKATAGLHHPLRHYSAGASAWEFGYLNVFVAAVIAATGGASEAELRNVLAQQAPEAFSFEANRLRCARRVLSEEQIGHARRTFAVSFGSCSFTEPVEGLRALRLL